uniref:Uncharacterized protein n=1 Tax=Anguilla anguilla TaxID=7936 RepID=A0A0E9X7D5_ANGAN
MCLAMSSLIQPCKALPILGVCRGMGVVILIRWAIHKISQHGSHSFLIQLFLLNALLRPFYLMFFPLSLHPPEIVFTLLFHVIFRYRGSALFTLPWRPHFLHWDILILLGFLFFFKSGLL